MSGRAVSGRLAGHRVLIVEDEALVALLLEDAVLDAGGVVVGPATNIADALKLAADSDMTVATLDLNLGGRPSGAVAEALTGRGVPFVVVSGYGSAGREGFPAAARGARVIAKPFDESDVVAAIVAVVG